MSKTDIQKYNGVAMTLHWIIAALMIYMIFFGENLIRQPRGSTADIGTFLPSLHVSIGVAILLLTLARLAWRVMNPPPPYPATMKDWEILLSKLTHGLFYVAMIGLPITGWLAFADYLQTHAGLAGTSVFGLFGVPPAPELGRIAESLHGLGSNATMALFFLHVAAALKHQFIDGDGIFRRMLPF